ncbi:ABC transporter permease subunit [Taklimakanibacter lacteus]|uniref:ABC transporter permease subunit n=1 Tax=Taklimakanibacter lacteus TaxID=2268456 RepID=UPI0013C46439
MRERASGISRRLLTGDRLFRTGALGITALVLFIFVAFPIAAILREGLVLADGTWGLGNFIDYFRDPRFLTITGRSLLIAVSATVITVVLAYGFAYALVRTQIPLKNLWRFTALLPVFAPSLVQALGVQFLLGRNGLVSNLLGIRLDIYGFWGILISDIVYAFPHAVLIMVTALSVTDGRLYEAGRMLGASEFRLFRTITLPASRYGVMSAAFVVFTIVITDFGNAMVIGGDYSVLATEIYNQVSGQANFRLGAVIGIILLIPAALAMFVERLVARRNTALVNERSSPLVLRKSVPRDICALVYAVLVCALILLIVGIVVLASFVKLWPYDVSLTLKHYVTDVQNGYAPLWTSLWMSLIAAVLGTALVVLNAYMIEKISNPFTRVLYFLSVLPAAVPGMVLGLGYIMAFNDPANPIYWLYGTVWFLALNTIFHYHAQAFLIATTNIKQISSTFDEASAMLGATFLRTMARIALPLLLPSLLTIGLFLFMRAMVTLSAVIFLVSPRNTVAAVSVLLLDDSGKASQAAAFSVVIMAVVLAASAGFNLLLGIPLARRHAGASP